MGEVHHHVYGLLHLPNGLINRKLRLALTQVHSGGHAAVFPLAYKPLDRRAHFAAAAAEKNIDHFYHSFALVLLELTP